jgi:hypothetical protein
VRGTIIREDEVTAKFWLTLTIAICGAVAVTGAEAAAKKKARAERPVVSGCTKAIPPFCIGITSGKTTYALFDTNPYIPPGTGVTIWGKVTSVSPCGTAISVTAWKKNKLKCRA